MGSIVSSVRDVLWYFTSTVASRLYDTVLRLQGNPRDNMVHRLLVASYTDSIHTLEYDPSKPSESALAITSKIDVGFHPSWLAKHPSDPTLIFTGLEQADGRLLALKYDVASGKGEVVANVPSGGHSPCTVLALETEVFTGNYMEGTVSIHSISKNSSAIKLEEYQSLLKFSGTGPCSERQEMSHPHQVYYSSEKDGQGEVLVPDLGADKIWRLAKNGDGIYKNAGVISFDNHLGGGPRHVAVHDGVLYTLLELTCNLTAHKLPPLSSSVGPSLLTSSPTLSTPPDVPHLTMLAAELVLAPSNATFPTSYLYASTRNVPRPGGDVITVFSTITSSSNSPEIPIVNEIETGLNHLRGFILFGPDDRYLIAGGANGGGIKVFERIDGGRDLRELAHLTVEDGGSGLCPTAFVSLD